MDYRDILFLVSQLKQRDQISFFRSWLRDLKAQGNSELIKDVYMAAANAYMPDERVEAWLLARLKKNRLLTPDRLASEYLSHSKMGAHMRPYLISVARRVKTRLRVQRLRRGDSDAD